MTDRFEDFIREHSSEFDLHEPGKDLWAGIEQKIGGKKAFNWRYILSRAAIIVMIFGASLMVQRLWLSDDRKKLTNKEKNVEIEIPELKEAETYYKGLINAKLNEVKPLLSQYPSLEEELHTDLNELDSIYNGLKIDLKDNIANQEVIEAMIQNYRLRISILEDMLVFLESQTDNDSIKNTGYEL